jgi:hypothetical protein
MSNVLAGLVSGMGRGDEHKISLGKAFSGDRRKCENNRPIIIVLK